MHSKTHQRFSNRLQNPEALTNPQDFLGPNYETVINFWWTMDSLTEDQWNEVARRYVALDSAAWSAAYFAAWNAAFRDAWSVAGDAARYAARDAAWDVASVDAASVDAAGHATLELMGMHTLLNDGKDLLFVPLFNDL
jgi:hypothetical protein